SNQGGACSDGNDCTANDACGASGTCQGAPSQSGYASYFSDPLGDNAQGWLVHGPPAWTIAPTDPLPPCATGSPTGFSRWRGAVPRAPCSLVAPPIDASQASSLWLEFSHELQVKADVITADVFDGIAWANVWTAAGFGGAFVECSWVRESIDITSFKW